jgi:hypothetical protein
MLESVNLLMLDNVVGRTQQKLTKNKEIYQLQNIDDDTYMLSPFKMIVYKGNFREYLKEKGISLCFKIDESDILINEEFNNLIETYLVKEMNESSFQNDIALTKKTHKKGFQ